MYHLNKEQKNLVKNAFFALDIFANSDILYGIGCGNPYKAAVVSVNGGKLPKESNADSLYFESAGRTLLCGVTLYTFATPAGSFLVSGVATGEKSLKEKACYKGGLNYERGNSTCSPWKFRGFFLEISKSAFDKNNQQCYIVCKELETLCTQRELLSVNGGNFQTQNQRTFGLIEPEKSGRRCVDVFQLGKPFFYALETGVEKDKSSMPKHTGGLNYERSYTVSSPPWTAAIPRASHLSRVPGFGPEPHSEKSAGSDQLRSAVPRREGSSLRLCRDAPHSAGSQKRDQTYFDFGLPSPESQAEKQLIFSE